MSITLLASTFFAGFLYVVMPGPAVLALFALAASEGRPAAARFVTGHLVGDVVWGTLALAAIIGVAQVGATIFNALGLACGLYLCWLGLRAIRFRGGEAAAPIGANNPLATGIVFGLTNPKAYPVSLAMFTALTASFAGQMDWSDAPALMGAAFFGFIAADILMVFWAGLPLVRRFFARHEVLLTRGVGFLFLLFGAKSIADAASGFLRRA